MTTRGSGYRAALAATARHWQQAMTDPPHTNARRAGRRGLELGSVGIVGCATFSILIGVVAFLLYLLLRAIA